MFEVVGSWRPSRRVGGARQGPLAAPLRPQSPATMPSSSLDCGVRMPGFALLLLQASSAVTVPDERLLHPVPQRRCDTSGAEILVCAKDRDAYRLHGAGPAIEPTVATKAEWRLFGDTKMDVHAESRGAPGGGGSAPAAMVTVTVPF
jgi:hypothetical protein